MYSEEKDVQIFEKTESNFKPKQRIPSLDVLRGICMICVVIGHCGISGLKKYVYVFHMPVFFLISGYFFNQNISFKVLFRKKVWSLIIPYYVSCIPLIVFYPLLSYIRGGYIAFVSAFIDIIKAIIYATGEAVDFPVQVRAIGALWFLWALFWSQIIYYWLCKISKKKFIIVVVLAIVSAITSNYVILPLSIQQGCFALPYIFIGSYIKEHNIFNELKSKWKRFIITVASLIGYGFMIHFYSGVYMVNCNYGNGLYDYIGTLFCVALVGIISIYISRYNNISRLIKFYGKNSLLFLAIHNIELYVFPYHAIYIKVFRATVMQYNNNWIELIYLIMFKFSLISLFMYIGIKIPEVKKLYGCKT